MRQEVDFAAATARISRPRACAPSSRRRARRRLGDGDRSLRYRTVGPEIAGSQIVGRMIAGRALVSVRVARIVRVGAEARVRGEAIDRLETAEDEGRPVEIVSGGVLGIDARPVLVQALGGWSWPRGPLGTGPAALAAATFSF